MATSMLTGLGNNELVELVEVTPTAAEFLREAQSLNEHDQSRLLVIARAMRAGRFDITPERAAALTRAEINNLADSLLN